MAVMKTLHIAMTDPVNMYHENEDLDYYRRQAWHDAIDGIYVPETYSGDARVAYDVGRQQIEETCHEEGIDLFKTVLASPIEQDKPKQEIYDTVTPDGMPTDEQWASYFKDV